MQRSAIFSCCDLRVCLARLFQRMFPCQRDYTMQLGIELLQPIEIDMSSAVPK